MESEGVTSALNTSVLNKDDLDKMPKDVRGKYEEFFTEFVQIKALYETLKMNSGENGQSLASCDSWNVEILSLGWENLQKVSRAHRHIKKPQTMASVAEFHQKI